MKWLIQENFYSFRNIELLKDAFDKHDISYEIVNANTIGKYMSDDFTEDILALGGNSINKVSNDLNWRSKEFYSEFDFKELLKKYGKYMLNSDVTITNTENVPLFEGKKFIRPTKDNKRFNGGVFTRKEFQEVTEGINSTEITISDVKNIRLEDRFFVIDGNIISQSRYKLDNSANISTYVSENAINFVIRMLNIYQPTKGFVIDVALTDDGYKIVEFNNLLSSSFYNADVKKIINEVKYFMNGWT